MGVGAFSSMPQSHLKGHENFSSDWQILMSIGGPGELGSREGKTWTLEL